LPVKLELDNSFSTKLGVPFTELVAKEIHSNILNGVFVPEAVKKN
jgi:hypothetical protein